MRCSSCKPLLERYLEGTLHAHRISVIAAHLDSCASCNALLTELKVVDGLLTTVAASELAPNFSFAVMAQAHSVPAPRTRRAQIWPLLVLYVTVAWIALAAWLITSGADIRALAMRGISTVAAPAAGFPSAVGSALTSLNRGDSLFHLVGGVLILDLMLAVGLFLVYRMTRSRTAVQPVSIRERS